MDAVLARYAETVLSPTWAQTTHDRPFTEVLATLIGFMTSADGSRPAGCLLSMMRVLSSDLGPATKARVEALGARARDIYADWVERARTRGEITSSVPTPVAAAFIDTQFTMLLVQMALGAEPEPLRAQAGLAFAGLTGVVRIDRGVGTSSWPSVGTLSWPRADRACTGLGRGITTPMPGCGATTGPGAAADPGRLIAAPRTSATVTRPPCGAPADATIED